MIEIKLNDSKPRSLPFKHHLRRLNYNLSRWIVMVQEGEEGKVAEEEKRQEMAHNTVFIMVILGIVVWTANVWLETPSTRTPNDKPHLHHLYVEELDGLGQIV
jgi:hypothetical protein